MAIKTEEPKDYQLIDLSFEANESLTAFQNCVVVPVAASAGRPKVGAPSGQGVLPMGVLMNAPAIGATAEVRTAGIIGIKAGGAFNAGILLTIKTTDGTVEAAATGDYVVGMALEAAAEAGHIVSVQLMLTSQLN